MKVKSINSLNVYIYMPPNIGLNKLVKEKKMYESYPLQGNKHVPSEIEARG